MYFEEILEKKACLHFSNKNLLKYSKNMNGHQKVDIDRFTP